jgi:hypothetical protein
VFIGPRPITASRFLQKHTRSKGPSLLRHYPASQVIWPSPTPARTNTQSYCCGSRPRIRDGPPTLRNAPSRRAILITPVDQDKCICRLLPRPASAFPVYRSGQRPQLYFRGLLKVHSRYGPPVRCLPIADICPQSFSRQVSLTYCLGSYRDEPTISRAELTSAGTLHHRGAPIYCGIEIFCRGFVFLPKPSI